MIRSTSETRGYAIHGSDGVVGTIDDFLFDDASWFVRWLIVDTGNWLLDRKVLLPASVLRHVDHTSHRFSVGLTRQQVKAGPDIDTDLPVSRQMETNLYDHFGQKPYWNNASYIGLAGLGGAYLGGSMAEPVSLGIEPRKKGVDDSRRSNGDPHLRSIDAVTEYQIHATDGEVGHVDDILVEDDDWRIRYFVVDTRNWWPGRKVLISPLLIRAIHWADRQVDLGFDRQRVKDSPAYDPSTVLEETYERRLSNHYATFG